MAISPTEAKKLTPKQKETVEGLVLLIDKWLPEAYDPDRNCEYPVEDHPVYLRKVVEKVAEIYREKGWTVDIKRAQKKSDVGYYLQFSERVPGQFDE